MKERGIWGLQEERRQGNVKKTREGKVGDEERYLRYNERQPEGQKDQQRNNTPTLFLSLWSFVFLYLIYQWLPLLRRVFLNRTHSIFVFSFLLSFFTTDLNLHYFLLFFSFLTNHTLTYSSVFFLSAFLLFLSFLPTFLLLFFSFSLPQTLLPTCLSSLFNHTNFFFFVLPLFRFSIFSLSLTSSSFYFL